MAAGGPVGEGGKDEDDVAIPVGTTARQLGAMARWMLACVIVLGMLTWWWPGLRGWAGLIAGLNAVLVLWALWRLVAGDGSVPGHPIHLAMLLPIGVLLWHLAEGQLDAAGDPRSRAAGSLTVALILELSLVGLGAMLTQSLLPRAARHVTVLAVCGAAMLAGPAAAMVWAPTGHAHTALALLGFAGVGVWLSAMWGPASADTPHQPRTTARSRMLRGACLAVAIGAAGILAVVAPLPALLAGGLAAATVVLAGLVFHRGRTVLLLVGGGGCVAAAGVLTLARWVREAALSLLARPGRAGWFGSGERAFADLNAGDAGLLVLLRAVGWVGAAWFVLTCAAAIVWLLLHARRGHAGDRARAILWTASSLIAGAAFLAPGGAFIPAVVLGMILTWGLLPAMLGRTGTRRSGLLLLAAVLIVLGVHGVVRHGGLLAWVGELGGAGDKAIHLLTGFLVTLLAAWQLGRRRVGLGLAAIALAALAGGVGEVAQFFASSRSAEFVDWAFHAAGCAVAVVPYLLAIGARACESSAVRRQRRAARAYIR